MFGNTFYYDLVRKYTIYVGALHNQIYINRQSNAYDGLTPSENIETIKVPIAYGPAEKFLSRVLGDPTLTKPFAIVLPRMSFELTGLVYDADRKRNRMNKIYKFNSNTDIMSTISDPIPYNFFYSLYIMSANFEDSTKIVEQILPWFQPEWTARLSLLPEVDQSLDIPLIITSTQFQDTYEGKFEQRRAIVWQINYMLKGWLYGPIQQSGQIKQVFVNFKIPANGVPIANSIGNTATSEFIYSQPGLTANGEPTTNVHMSIPPADINYDDDWAYIVEIEGNG